MDIGHFYFLNDQYYIDFDDEKLMTNKDMINGVPHNRPCFYAVQDTKTGIYWMIPISSQVSKYKAIYRKKTQSGKQCDTLVFGQVLGRESVFLIQNMCPVSQQYIANEYIDRVHKCPVKVKYELEQELKKKTKKVLALQRQGKKIIFPDVLDIEQKLISQQKDLKQV